MKHLIKAIYCNLFLLLISCNFKPCEKVTDKDIIGYYVPCNPRNQNKQYIKILENHTFTMAYCNGDSVVIEQGTWDRYNGCRVMLDGIRWFGFPADFLNEKSRYRGNFNWVRGKLSMGDDIGSFQKTWKKPKLSCSAGAGL